MTIHQSWFWIKPFFQIGLHVRKHIHHATMKIFVLRNCRNFGSSLSSPYFTHRRADHRFSSTTCWISFVPATSMWRLFCMAIRPDLPARGGTRRRGNTNALFLHYFDSSFSSFLYDDFLKFSSEIMDIPPLPIACLSTVKIDSKIAFFLCIRWIYNIFGR